MIRTPMIRSTAWSLLLTLTPIAPAFAATPPAIAAAVADPARPAEDRERDDERKPAEMLAFTRVKPGMTVVDVMPGGGYFTRLFADVVGPTGKVIGYVPQEYVTKSPKALDRITALAAQPGRGNISVMHDPLDAPGPVGVVDIVWTAQNYHDLHNLPGADLVGFNKLVYASLKPGGVYVILDHSAPKGSGLADTNTTHRIDAATVKAEVLAAGFKYDGESKVLANPADPRTAKVFDPTIRSHTDQFIYRFRKPAK